MANNSIWKILTCAAGDITIATGVATRTIKLQHIFISVKNKCDMYFFYDKSGADVKVFPTIHFVSNGSFTTRDGSSLEIMIPDGKDLQVNFTEDPGTEIGVIYQVVN